MEKPSWEYVYEEIMSVVNEDKIQNEVESIWEVDVFKEIMQQIKKLRNEVDLFYFQDEDANKIIDTINQNRVVLKYFLEDDVIADLKLSEFNVKQIKGFVHELDVIDLPLVKSNLNEREAWLKTKKEKTSEFLEPNLKLVEKWKKELNLSTEASFEKYFKETEYILHSLVNKIKNKDFDNQQNQQLLNQFNTLTNFYHYQQKNRPDGFEKGGFMMLEKVATNGVIVLNYVLEKEKGLEK